MPETCGPDESPRGVFIEIKGITSRAEQEYIYKIFKTAIEIITEESFKVATIQQKEGLGYNIRRECDNHETLFERHGKAISG